MFCKSDPYNEISEETNCFNPMDFIVDAVGGVNEANKTGL